MNSKNTTHGRRLITKAFQIVKGVVIGVMCYIMVFLLFILLGLYIIIYYPERISWDDCPVGGGEGYDGNKTDIR